MRSLCISEQEKKGDWYWEGILCGAKENALVYGSVKQGRCSPTDSCIWQGSKVCVPVWECGRLGLHRKWSEDEKGGICL